MKVLLASIIVLTLVISSTYFAIFRPKNLPENSTVTEQGTLLNSSKSKINSPISIEYLRSLTIDSEALVLEEELSSEVAYSRYIASYISEGNKVYGLLTIPTGAMPQDGYPAIVFDHGYIPPTQYITTSGYVAYVDYLAKNGFVVFKIDFRGNGKSEGDPSGSYFSSAYTIDAVSAVKSLQKFEKVNPKRIGMWGHSMSGNVLLRSMLVSGDIKAGVIWAGAVYSYKDFVTYKISDNSYVHRPYEIKEGIEQSNRETSAEIQKIRNTPEDIDFNSDFWKAISLTENISYLKYPLQIHHAKNDDVVNIGYSKDLGDVLKSNNKTYELYEYEGGGHNITSPYFEKAMERTVEFFKKYL
jgi:uncharacterized protein